MTDTDLEQRKRALVDQLLAEGRLVTPEELEKLLQPAATPMPETLAAPLPPALPAAVQAEPPTVSTRLEALPALPPAPETHGLSPAKVQVIKSYNKPSKSRTVQDFVGYFSARQTAFERLLQGRGELQNLTSCARLALKKGREAVSIIGLVQEKQTTKTGSIMLHIEDRTGTVKVIVSARAPEALVAAKDLVHDEVIGIAGTMGDGCMFANRVVLPEVPLNEPKQCPEEAYAAVLSDVHVGSKIFLSEAFERFLAWTRGEWGPPEARHMAERLRYVIAAGDVVDGVGIYPSQEKELAITDITQQYEECARLFSKIPPHIATIICPGNHDAMRLSEPQLPLGTGFSLALTKIPNVTLVSNPAVVNVHALPEQGFSGMNVLMYHGYSYDYYGDTVESIRTSGKNISDRVGLIMKFLVQRRHLAPAHGSTLYIPDHEQDPLIMEQVPDIFVSGHIHKTAVISHRSVLMVSGSCFQGKTAFQEKVGHNPDPGVVPVINLKTRKVVLIDFSKAEMLDTPPVSQDIPLPAPVAALP